MEQIKIMIPAYLSKELDSFLQKSKKNITELEWSLSEPYKKMFYHTIIDDCGYHREKEMHEVQDLSVTIPTVSDWALVAVYEDDAVFVADPTKKLVLKNPEHGVNYRKCDVCKHSAKHKSFVIENINTGEELQVGRECLRKFNIGLIDKIYSCMAKLYKTYDLRFGWSDDMDEEWPHGRFKDPHTYESIEISIAVQAAKKYHDDNNGLWKPGRQEGREYIKSPSAAAIKHMTYDYKADDENEYYKGLMKWMNEVFVPQGDFDEKIKSLTIDNYYMSRDDISLIYFAIKKYEQYVKEMNAQANGQYIPKVDDYIHIKGKVVDKIWKEGYFGKYLEYQIKNDIDNNIYKRAGSVTYDPDTKEVECYAFVKNVWNGNYTLDRCCKGRKKGIEIANEK